MVAARRGMTATYRLQNGVLFRAAQSATSTGDQGMRQHQKERDCGVRLA